VTTTTQETDFSPRHSLDSANLIDLFSWTEEEFLRRTEGSAIRRIGYIRWLRNIAVALGNSEPRDDVIGALRTRQTFPSELVGEHIRWALDRLAARSP
jgi:epoxyqueuosine reductase